MNKYLSNTKAHSLFTTIYSDPSCSSHLLFASDYFIMLKNLNSVLSRKENKEQAQTLLSLETMLPAVLAFMKE